MRAINRVIAVVLAGAILVAGTITAVEVVWASFGDEPALIHWQSSRRWLSDHTLADAESVLICIGLIIIGLVLLACALRRPPRPMTLGGHGPGLRADVNRRSLQRAVRTLIEHDRAVASARVRLHRHTLRLDVTARETSTVGLAEAVAEQVSAYLDALEPAVPPRLRVKARAGTRESAQTAPAPAETAEVNDHA